VGDLGLGGGGTGETGRIGDCVSLGEGFYTSFQFLGARIQFGLHIIQ
jgi:hypothetical protein